ncbi:MAG: PEP-CTERM sorting domain-containing protein [Rhodocyclaceae bacterium]
MNRYASLALALCCGLSLSAQATTVNTGQLFISPNFFGGTGASDQTVTQTGAISLSGSATGGFNSSGHGSTFVDYGVIKLDGEAFGSLNAISRGIFRDNVIITAAGVATGTPGSLTYAIFVDGTLAVGTGSSAAGWQLQADLGGGAFDINRSATLFGNDPSLGVHGYTGDPFGLYTATINFQFGIAMQLDVELTSSAQAAYSGTSPVGTMPYASHDLSHSLYWGGISNVSANGVQVASFTAAGESGTNYSLSLAPVPEPASWASLLGGLGIVFATLRRRLKH